MRRREVWCVVFPWVVFNGADRGLGRGVDRGVERKERNGGYDTTESFLNITSENRDSFEAAKIYSPLRSVGQNISISRV